MKTLQPKLEFFQQAIITALQEGTEPAENDEKELLRLVKLRYNTTNVAKKQKIFYVILKKFKFKRFTGTSNDVTQWNMIGATIKAIEAAIVEGQIKTTPPSPASEEKPFVPPEFMRSVRAAFFRDPDSENLTFINH